MKEGPFFEVSLFCKEDTDTCHIFTVLESWNVFNISSGAPPPSSTGRKEAFFLKGHMLLVPRLHPGGLPSTAAMHLPGREVGASGDYHQTSEAGKRLKTDAVVGRHLYFWNGKTINLF